jgi:hypothetical protein
MIQVTSIEQRTLITPGKPATTIVREVKLRNGKGRKTIRVLKGSRVVSEESDALNLTERRHIQKRKFRKGLYKGVERRTLRRLN